ncbi:MAG: DUF6531 domain-containing protein [Oscillospiraceae bacterium]|nr:DUF6531 domain-containing protein [Oscillospiraceae bacterium]
MQGYSGAPARHYLRNCEESIAEADAVIESSAANMPVLPRPARRFLPYRETDATFSAGVTAGFESSANIVASSNAYASAANEHRSFGEEISQQLRQIYDDIDNIVETNLRLPQTSRQVKLVTQMLKLLIPGLKDLLLRAENITIRQAESMLSIGGGGDGGFELQQTVADSYRLENANCLQNVAEDMQRYAQRARTHADSLDTQAQGLQRQLNNLQNQTPPPNQTVAQAHENRRRQDELWRNIRILGDEAEDYRREAIRLDEGATNVGLDIVNTNQLFTMYRETCVECDAHFASEFEQLATEMQQVAMQFQAITDSFCPNAGIIDWNGLLDIKDQMSPADQEALSVLFFKAMLALAGVNDFCLYGFDPVNMSTGNFIYSKEDISVPGRFPLEFKRFYNSLGGTESVLGANWTHNYNIRLEDKENAVHISFGDGHVETYNYSKEDGYTSPQESDYKLEKADNGWELSSNTNENHKFDKLGLLQSICDANGNATEFEYNDTTLTKVSTLSGSLSFEHDKSGRISKVSDHTGREVKLEYSDVLLNKVVHPSGAEYKYSYDSYGHLSTITNPLGVESIRNKYDENGRMVAQSFADGGECSLSYENKMTIATEQNGNEIKYEHDSKYRTIRTIYSDSEERFEYNEQSKRTKHIDRNGNETSFEYDASGNVTKAIDSLGYETTLEYNTFNKPTKITNPVGGIVSNEYDDKGNMTAVIDPLGHVVKLSNDGHGFITDLTLPDGSVSNVIYDDRGNMQTIVDVNGNEISYEYDELNRVVATVDANGNNTKFEYTVNGDISKVFNADGKEQMFEYNESGKVTKVIDFSGGVTEYKYNQLGKVEEIINPSDGVTKLEYDLMWNVTAVTDPCGNTVRYVYDENQRVIQSIDEGGNAKSYEHDPNGNVIAAISPLGTRTEMKYDALDRPIEVVEPDGSVTKIEYDALGNATKATDSQNGEIHRTYDVAGQLTSVTDQVGNTTTHTYTSLGQVESTINALGEVTKYDYYLGGKLKSITRPGGETDSYEYDKNGNMIKLTDALGGVTLLYYDCLDRIIKTTDALGHTKQFSYDALGNITGITDENGNLTRYEYSPIGELVEVIDAMGHSTKYGYDKLSRMTRMEQYRIVDETIADIKQIELQATTWDRNELGEVVKKSTPLGGESQYKYDSMGNLISQIDEEGLETLYEYNLANKLAKVAYADGKTVELSYNPLRQLTEMKDWLGTTKIELDPLGRATKVTDYNENVVEYAWDKLGRRESVTYPDKSMVNYGYDISGRIKEVSSSNGTTTYNYNIAERLLERIMPDNIVTYRKADPLGRLESLTHQKNNEVLDSFKYSYDPAGNITQIDKYRSGMDVDNGVFDYVYDKLGRLTEASNSNSSKQYHYDSLGNRIASLQNGIETRHSYNARNQLIKTTEGELVKDYSYDARGNLTGIIENGVNTSSFTYNAANRMVEAITSKGKAEYEYNGFLKRVSKLETMQGNEVSVNDPLKEIRYTLDLTKPYNDLLAIGNQRFVWGNELLQSEGSDNYSYLTDHLGSPIRLVGNEQQETLSYDEFGVPTVESSDNMHNPFGFTGYQTDGISGMQYAQARYYEPAVGRFSAEDTHWHPENMIFGDAAITLPNAGFIPYQPGVVQGANLYSYCIGNPISNFDPTGMTPKLLLIPPAVYWASLMALVALGVLTFPEAQERFVYATERLLEEIMDMHRMPIYEPMPMPTYVPAPRIPDMPRSQQATMQRALVPALTAQQHLLNTINLSEEQIERYRNWAVSQAQTGRIRPEETNDHTVYIIRRIGGTSLSGVWYVGITGDFFSRQRDHQVRVCPRRGHIRFPNPPYLMSPVATDLSKEDARALEQLLIMAFTLEALANKINAIGNGKFSDFDEEFDRMISLMEGCLLD